MKKNFFEIKTRVKKILISLFSILTYSTSAFAYGQTTVGKLIESLCEWLSGEIGAGIAILVVIYSGYEMLEGNIDKKKLVGRVVALGLIIGGAYIAKNVFELG